MKNEVILQKTFLNTIKARYLKFFQPHQTPRFNNEKYPRSHVEGRRL